MGKVTSIRLPGENPALLEIPEAVELLNEYWTRLAPAVWPFFDSSAYGPRNEIQPLDVLSLAALNAFGPRPPMEALTALWQEKRKVERCLSDVTGASLQELDQRGRHEAARQLEAVAKVIEAIPGWGGTSTAKLIHRMRPTLAPIWDTLVDQWYEASTSGWLEYYDMAMSNIAHNVEALDEAVRRSRRPGVSVVRAWDVLLWTLATKNRQSTEGAPLSPKKAKAILTPP